MKPRVLMTTTAYPPSIGGVQGYLADLCSRLQEFEPDVASLWLETRTDWLLGTTLRLGEPVQDGSSSVRKLGWSRRTRARMAPWVLAYYAVVTVAGPRVAAAMIPYLDRLVGPEHRIIHSHRIGREFLAQASLAVARRHGVPFVLTPYHHPRWKGYRYLGWTRVYRAADALFALTESEKAELERLGVVGERIHVVYGAGDDPAPADPERFRSRVGLLARPMVLFLGQLYEYKGVAQLFAAAENLHRRGFDFDVVFAGPPTPFSRGFFARRARPWLHLVGPVDDQTKWDALAAASLLCVPSAQESFGRVFLEAWSKGKPVIGGKIPAVSEVVQDGKTGLLVDPASVAELERALESLLSQDDLAARLGAAGAAEVEKRFNWSRVAARVESVYHDLLVETARATSPS